MRFADELRGSEGEWCMYRSHRAIIRAVYDGGEKVKLQFTSDGTTKVVSFVDVQLEVEEGAVDKAVDVELDRRLTSPADGLPVAAPDPASVIEHFLTLRSPAFMDELPRWSDAKKEARAALAALLVERQQDKERIERLEAIRDAAQEYMDAERQNDAALVRLLNAADPDGTKAKVQALTRANADAAFVALAAALAVEEDTENG